MAIGSRIMAGLRAARVAPMKTVGAPGFSVHSGYLDDREKQRELRGSEKYRTYSDLLANVSIVAASTRYFLNLVAKAGWRAEPPEGSGARGDDIAEAVEDIMKDMTTPWHRVVRRASMYKFHGFSVQEWTAKRRPDGLIGMRDVEPRPQATIERWDTDESGTVLGMVQRSPQTQEEIYLPREKTVYMVDDALNDTPEGLGLFRHLSEPGLRLQRYQLLEAYGYETDLRGIPIARGPLGALQELVDAGQMKAEDKDAAVQPLEDFIRGHIRSSNTGLLLDSATYTTTDERSSPSNIYQWTLELLRGDAAMSSEAVAKAIERLNREMARILGTEFLLLGGDGKGSLALAREKTQQFALQIDSTLRELEETFESDWLRPLFMLNGWPDELRPELKTEQIQFRDVEQVTQSLVDLAQAGAPVNPMDPAVAEVYELLGLSKPDPIELVTLPDEPDPTPPDEGGDDDELPASTEQEAEEETE